MGKRPSRINPNQARMRELKRKELAHFRNVKALQGREMAAIKAAQQAIVESFGASERQRKARQSSDVFKAARTGKQARQANERKQAAMQNIHKIDFERATHSGAELELEAEQEAVAKLRHERRKLASREKLERLEKLRKARMPIAQVPVKVNKLFDRMEEIENAACDEIEKLGFRINREKPRETLDGIYDLKNLSRLRNMLRVNKKGNGWTSPERKSTKEEYAKAARAERIAWDAWKKMEALEEEAQALYGFLGKGGYLEKRIRSEESRLRGASEEDAVKISKRIKEMREIQKQCLGISIGRAPFILQVRTEIERVRGEIMGRNTWQNLRPD